MVVVFTGIIQHVGSIVSAAASPAGKRLRIQVGPLAERLTLGASLCVDGVCLTASAISGSVADFDVVPETLSRSTLGRLRVGSRVNLEPALLAGGPLDGHIVQGHVDGVTTIARVQTGLGGHVLTLASTHDLAAGMIPKGSIAVAGVSLTLAEVTEREFSVALVPTTLAATTLGELKAGEPVNIELDIIGKYVRRYLQRSGGGLTLESLRRAGLA